MSEDIIEKVVNLESSINASLKHNNRMVKIAKHNDKKGFIIIMQKDKTVDRALEFEIVSMCQIDITEGKEVIESGFFINSLEKWIYNLYNPTEYRYIFCGGALDKKVLKPEEIEEITIGKVEDYSKARKSGGTAHRKELDNQPIVEGYLSPMFEKIDYGIIYLRYETQEIYDRFY